MKSLRLQSNQGNKSMNMGKVINLAMKDSQKLEDIGRYVNYCHIGIFQWILCYAVLTYYIGIIPSTAALVVFALFFPLQLLFSKEYVSIRRKLMTTNDALSNLLTDLLSGVQVVKLYAWERPFFQKVVELRKDLYKNLSVGVTFRGFNESLYFSSVGIMHL